jgi:CBS domain-containing protein/Zn-dependent protease
MPGQSLSRRPKLGSLLFIRTRVHSSCYIAILLIAGILVTQFPQDYPVWQRVIVGVAGGSLFLASTIISQILTNIAGLLVGIPLRNVTLFVFGEVAQVPEDGTRPFLEAIMGVVALFLNVIMAVVFNWLFLNQSGVGNILVLDLLQWLSYFWYMLALFNIMPFLPLAGGKILVGIIWKTTGDYLRAIRAATLLGWGFSLILTIGGFLLLILSRQIENGLLLIFFGWALQRGATLIRRRATLLAALQNTKATDMISGEFPSIDPDRSLGQVIHDHILKNGQDYFTVTEEGRLQGVVAARNMKRVKRARWDSTPVGGIMTPVAAISTVQGGRPAAHVLEQMDQFRVDNIPVLEKDELIGIVVREKLMRLARIRAQLRV